MPLSSLISPPSKTWWNTRLGSTLRLLALALVVIALWLTIENRWGKNFQLPTRYWADSQYYLGMMRLAQQGDLGLFTHIYTDSLGAPFRGQLNDFPEPERAIVWLGGQIARITGLMPAANILLIISCTLSAFSFYLSTRLWKISRIVAWTLALVYAFLPHTLRSLNHLGVVFSGLLPLQLYALWYIATTPVIRFASSRFRLSVVIGFLSGFFNVYWIFFFVQIYVLVFLYRLIKRKGDLLLSLVPLVLMLLVSVGLLSSFYIYKIQYGENFSASFRSYLDVELFSLKPIELFLPGDFKQPEFLAKFLNRYYSNHVRIGEEWRAYIGILPIIGVIALFLKGIQRQIDRRSPSLPYLLTLWIIAWCSFGGLHSIFSLIFDFYKIRGLNRYSPAIATIGLLYFSFVFNRIASRHFIRWRAPLILSLGAIALFDQGIRNFKYTQYGFPTTQMSEMIRSDQDLVVRLEEGLPSDAILFMLPALAFPEPFTDNKNYYPGLSYYHYMRPFLYSEKLRYSYGSNKGRAGADWQLDVQDLPAGEMAAKLESYGFSGVLLNRNGYEDRGEQQLAELAEAGWPMEFEQGVNNEWVFIRLTPAENPVLPTLTPYAITDSISHDLLHFSNIVIQRRDMPEGEE